MRPARFFVLIFFLSSTKLGRVSKITKDNFTLVLKCEFSDISYQLVFKGGSHIVVIKSYFFQTLIFFFLKI